MFHVCRVLQARRRKHRLTAAGRTGVCIASKPSPCRLRSERSSNRRVLRSRRRLACRQHSRLKHRFALPSSHLEHLLVTSCLQGYMDNLRRGTSWALVNMMNLYHSFSSSKDEDDDDQDARGEREMTRHCSTSFKRFNEEFVFLQISVTMNQQPVTGVRRLHRRATFCLGPSLHKACHRRKRHQSRALNMKKPRLPSRNSSSVPQCQRNT